MLKQTGLTVDKEMGAVAKREIVAATTASLLRQL